MLAMAQINYIRIASDMKDESYSKIARDLGIDRRTVKKYAELEDYSPKITPKRNRKAPVMDPVKTIIDDILITDKKAPKKQRHTAKRIHQRLIDEHNFQGSYSSVKKYVRKAKKKLYDNSQAAIPLKHTGGEAQCDFGELTIRHQGIDKKAHMLILSFPYSNAAFVQLFWGQNRECLLEGLTTIFEFINGVPNKIWFDNLTAAVSKVSRNGNRIFTESFRRFAAHYRFEPVFCNPGQGNEKGNVEKKVGYIRKNFFVPVPEFDNLEEFNQLLLVKSLKDMNRKHYDKKILITDLFKQEKFQFMQLPAKRYDNYRLEKHKTNKYAYVRVDKNIYTTSPEVANQEVWVKLKTFSIEILNENYELIVKHPRLYGNHLKSQIWEPYLDEFIKKPKAICYTHFFDELPAGWKKLIENSSDKRTALGLLNDYIQDGYSPEESLALINSYKFEENPILDYPFLNSKKDNLSDYDLLLKGGE